MNPNRPKRLREIAAGIAVISIGALLFVGTLVHALLYNPEQEIQLPFNTGSDNASSTVLSDTISTIGDLPVHLSIPSIRVDTQIQQVGITYRGNMGTPNNFTDVGWYKYGTVPGTRGSAVIDGHLDDGLAFDGVFKHLRDMKVGDDVFVTTEHNRTLHFVVIKVATYYYTDAPLQTIFHDTSGSYLNLITCDGNWLTSAQTDDHRLVVYTKLVL